MKHIHFKNIDSTNTYLKQNYKDLNNYTFVSATNQSKGHGRNSRTWFSNPNNLMFSLLIKDPKIMKKFSSLSIVSGVSVAKCLERLGFDNVMIKWPNDVYLNNKKICGILLESVSNEDKLECLCIGIGLNINQELFENSLENIATSLYIETSKKYNLNKIRKMIFKSLIEEIDNLETSNYLDYVNAHNYLYNKEAYANIDNELRLVKILEINNDNTLKVLYNEKEVNLFTDEISFHLN